MTSTDSGKPEPQELRVHAVRTPAEQVRTAVEVAAIVAAGLWALYTFVYEQRIKPLAEAAAFTVRTTVDQGATVNGVTFLTVHKRFENTGNVPIDVAAEALTIYGERVMARQRRVLLESSTRAEIRDDVPRKVVTVLYSIAKLRNGAVGGNQNSSFYISPQSSNEEDYLVAVPVKNYPIVKVVRKDFIEKAPIFPKLSVRILKTKLGGFDLQAPHLEGEYDSEYEYPIRPQR
ncbi:MAG TPA: hypothetical protein VFE16_14250 [Candidatus Cybelea sp.]|nr:hypothetical protein [Candidatus Cybelea sp.]